MDYEKQKIKESLETLEKIKSFKNLGGKQEYNLSQEKSHQIDIKIDNSVPHGQFVPSKVYPGSWRASEQTFKAMKKDIFALGDSLDELVSSYKCESCDSSLDRQFWIFCPYCGEQFRSER